MNLSTLSVHILSQLFGQKAQNRLFIAKCVVFLSLQQSLALTFVSEPKNATMDTWRRIV